MANEILPESILHQLPGIIVWKDLDLNFLGCNAANVKMIGFNSIDKVIGISDYDIKCPAASSAELFRKQDTQVIKSQKSIQLLDIHTYADNSVKMFITTKKPLYDQDGKIKGIVGVLNEIDNETLTKITLNLMQLDKNQKRLAQYNSNSKVITDRYMAADLSEKETIVLYYILHGYSSREIGDITCRSKRTVESHIESIKSKTGSSSKSDLIMYAISNGFLNMIPRSLISADLNLSIEIHEAYWDAVLK